MKKDKIYNILKLLICIVFFFSISNIVSFILSIFNLNKDNLSSFSIVLYQFVVSILLFFMLLMLYYKTYKKDFKSFKKNLKENIIKVIKLFIIFIIFKYVIGFISGIIMVLCGYGTNDFMSVNQKMIIDYVKASPILMILSVSLFGPFYEEGIFRLAFRKVINNKWLYIIISGSLFGLLHIFPLDEGVTLSLGIIQSISYVTMGMFFSYIYYKTDNIFISVGLHILNNLLSVIAIIGML